MAVTLSHQSALDALRMVRSEGTSVHEMDAARLAAPSAWVGKRLGRKNFDPDVWRWQQPSASKPLHILVPSDRSRVRGGSIVAHISARDLPPGSVLWLDGHSGMVCPELLFLQMAESFSFPALVMLGLELCGHFARQADDPLMGDVVDGIPAATDADSIGRYLASLERVKGLTKARKALDFVCDHAVSAPEAVLATMYGLPPEESGYGLGPVHLNERVRVADGGQWTRDRHRYPDLMFDFAPVGLNYDGSKHFDVSDLMVAAEAFARSDEMTRGGAREALRKKLLAARAKILDDNLRDRQLAAQGRIVLPITKEDLSAGERLDELTRQVLSCAYEVFGVDVDRYLKTLDDALLARDRRDLLGALAPQGGSGRSSYGLL